MEAFITELVWFLFGIKERRKERAAVHIIFTLRAHRGFLHHHHDDDLHSALHSLPKSCWNCLQVIFLPLLSTELITAHNHSQYCKAFFLGNSYYRNQHTERMLTFLLIFTFIFTSPTIWWCSTTLNALRVSLTWDLPPYPSLPPLPTPLSRLFMHLWPSTHFTEDSVNRFIPKINWNCTLFPTSLIEQISSSLSSDSTEKLQSLSKRLSSKPLWKCHSNTRIEFTTCFKELQETPEASPTKASCPCHCPLALLLTSKLSKVAVGGSEGLTSHQSHHSSSSTHHRL